MDAQGFQRFILQNGILGVHEAPLTLKSGRKSHFYVNWRRATNDAFLLDTLTDYLAQYIEEHQLPCDTFYGVPEGASKTAIITAMKLAKRSPKFGIGSHVVAMGRAKPKEHGDPCDRFFVGAPQGRTLVLEDTLTSGLSLRQTLTQLRDAEVNVSGILVLTDRSTRDSTFPSELKQIMGRDIPIYALSRARELLGHYLENKSVPPSLATALKQEWENLP